MMSGNHPDRNEMLKAIVEGSDCLTEHLAKCRSCRTLFELLSHHSTDRTRQVFELPKGSLYRQMAIARLVESRHSERSVSGRIMFDSWDQLTSLQTRDAAAGTERRLRLDAGRFVLEFVADRQLREWEFVARVYEDKHATREFILKVGRQKLFPEVEDCFFWSGPKPPRRIQLLSPKLRIDFGNLRW